MLCYPGLWTYGPEKGWYLSFDDGPDPEVTPRLLNWLRENHIKANFFVLGKHAKAYPEILHAIREDGHLIGFHGHEHESALFKSSDWVQNNFMGTEYQFFRAPYGRLWPWQYQRLKKMGQWVHWSLMTHDYLPEKHPKANLRRLQKKLAQASPGTIFVLHDSAQARFHLFRHLPLIADAAREKNMPFLRLDEKLEID